MHEEILTDSQIKFLPFISEFSSQFGLVGGTAIALQLGHRRSIDIEIVKTKIRNKYQIDRVFTELLNQITVVINGVKLTFYKYPFEINYSESFDNVIKMPNILTLGAMKAFAVGQRAKWKDYVDLYFIFKKHALSEISNKAKELFKGEFNEKLFREQLCYFGDIDYSEKVDFLPGFETNDEVIKESLKEVSLQK